MRKTYAAYYDHDDRIQSSSGGVFSLLAKQFDVIYGVAMTDDCYSAKFERVENDISTLRGSKYLQAKVGDNYRKVKGDLQIGKKVLFSGTSCQVNGLLCYLQKEYTNLFCVDLVCHGTPSPKLWRDYLHYQETKLGKIHTVNFRAKDEGWLDFGMKLNSNFFPKHTDAFMQMFLRDYCLRPACYECHAKAKKMSDITLADFWGIQNVSKKMFDNNGVSLVITRTDKGHKLFDDIKENLVFEEVNYEDAVKYNPAEFSSVKKPKERDCFFIDLNNCSFSQMEVKYAGPLVIPKWRLAASKIRNFLINIINHFGK